MVLPGLSTPYPLLLSLVCLITKLRFSVVEHSSEQVLLKKASLVLDVKDPPATAGNLDLIPGPGRPYTPQSSYAGVPQLLSLNSRASELHWRKLVHSKENPAQPKIKKTQTWPHHSPTFHDFPLCCRPFLSVSCILLVSINVPSIEASPTCPCTGGEM